MYFYREKCKSFTRPPTGKPLFPILKKATGSWLLLGSSLLLSAQAYALSSDPNSYDFGLTNINSSSSTKVFTLTGDNTAVKVIDAFAHITTTTDEFGNISTAHSNEFSIINNGCSNTTINNNCEFSVAFKPTSFGKKELALAVPYDALGNPTTNTHDAFGNPITASMISIFLKGEAASSVSVEVTPSVLNFGDVNVNGFSSSQTITVSNTGSLNAFIGDVSLANSSDFAFSDGCSGKAIEPKQSCQIKGIFTPKIAGTQETQLSLSIFDTLYNATNGNTAISSKLITLTGNGVVVSPDIALDPNSINFGDSQVNTSTTWQAFKIKNQGTGSLLLGEITIAGDSDTFELNNYCSNKAIAAGQFCSISAKFKPLTEGSKTLTLSIPSNDPDTATVTATLLGNGVGWCQGNYTKNFYASPQNNNFGTDVIGTTHKISAYVYNWSKGCDALAIDTITITGANANEFSIEAKNCYSGTYSHNNSSYSSCQFKTVFSPTVEGDKSAVIEVTLNDNSVKTIPITAKAVTTGIAELTVSPTSHDFGDMTAGVRNYNNSKDFIVENTGNINVQINSITATGHTTDFTGYKWSWCRYLDSLAPSEQCRVYTHFTPKEVGVRESVLTINSNAPDVNITVTGTGTEAATCSEENITIESVASGAWATRSASNTGQSWYYNRYNVPTTTWKRVKNLNADEVESPNVPRQGDVVRINPGHTVTGIPYATIKALCVSENATLRSLSDQGNYPSLNVIASDYIGNKGIIQGHNGTAENGTSICNSSSWWRNLDKGCSQPGASIYLSAAIVKNEGSIIAGHGGNGQRHAAQGGSISIYGNIITNTQSIGYISAGRGGNLTGIQSGRAGRGGRVAIWGNESLSSDGQGIFAGNGGNCNAAATATQHGGNGGHMRLNAGVTVDLLSGTFATGKGGTNCSHNGKDGRFNADPPVLNIAGANVKIEGGDVQIYGGEGWQLNLTDMQDTIKATGDITIAVGAGGSIDLTGISSTAFNAGGQVNIFADNIALDDGVVLSDIIKATNIVVGPSKILRDIAVTAPSKLSGEPGDVLPVAITLSNGSSAADTVTLNIVDSSGWKVSAVSSPATVDANGNVSVAIPALKSVDVEFSVTLAPTVGDSNVVTIIATSQADAEITDTADVQLNVVSVDTLLINDSVTTPSTGSSGSGTSGTCPTTGTITGMCQNDGQTIKDATIEGNVAGGFFEGTIIIGDTALISRITVKSGAVVEGGEFTGSIVNNGEMNNFSFVGSLLENGILGGNITGTNAIRSTVKNVQLSADASVEYVELEGTIIGDQNAPAMLTNLIIKDNVKLEGVVIGVNVEIGNNVTFGKGVRFVNVDAIPAGLSLTDVLPTLSISTNTGVTGVTPVDLSADIFSEGEGLLAAINATVAEQGWVLTQNTQHGYLQLNDGNFRYTVRTSGLRKTANSAGFRMSATQKVHFYTGTQLEVENQPVVQDINALQTALAAMGLPTVEVKEAGTIKVMNTDGSWYSARPDIFSERVGNEQAEGVLVEESVRFTFVDEQGDKRQQFFYAAPADMTALLTVDSGFSLDNNSMLRVNINGKIYQGRLDYRVTQGTAPADGKLQVISSVDGFTLIYPNGERQALYTN